MYLDRSSETFEVWKICKVSLQYFQCVENCFIIYATCIFFFLNNRISKFYAERFAQIDVTNVFSRKLGFLDFFLCNGNNKKVCNKYAFSLKIKKSVSLLRIFKQIGKLLVSIQICIILNMLIFFVLFFTVQLYIRIITGIFQFFFNLSAHVNDVCVLVFFKSIF